MSSSDIIQGLLSRGDVQSIDRTGKTVLVYVNKSLEDLNIVTPLMEASTGKPVKFISVLNG